MEYLADLFSSYLVYVETKFVPIFDSTNRLFALYLLTSGMVAFLIYKSAQRKMTTDETSFLRFLFPKKVWSHPSAWLDLRYYVFNGLLARFALLGISVATTALAYKLFSGGHNFSEVAGQSSVGWGWDLVISITYMFIVLFVSDFLAWFCHWLQHKSPLLWQFHKVHHSAEVMHPVSNYREHPIDNVLYLSVLGFGFGLVLALAVRIFGYLPSVPMVLGIPVLMFLFNIVGYNLRHSHVWLRWPGKLSMIFPSPAHHHVHHSSHPDHIDKNFAFMLPIWDVIFNTYEMPEDNRDVKFGIGDGNAEELDTCWRLYWVPFRDAFRVLQAQAKGVAFNMSKPEPVEKDAEPQKIHPAE